MVLVLFFVILILLLITLFSIVSLKIDIKNLKFNKEENNEKKLNDDYEVILYAYIFEKIVIYKYKFKNLKISKEYFNNINKKIDYSILKDFISSNVRKFNMDIIEIEKFNLNMQISTENTILTSGLVTFSNILISIFLPKFISNYNTEKIKYEVMPIYINKNKIELFFEGTIKIKLFSLIKAINSYSKATKKTSGNDRKRILKYMLAKNIN